MPACRWSVPECAIPLQTPIENLRAIPDAVLDWHAAGTAHRRLTADDAMPELTDVTNDFIRGEIDEFVERPDERERMIELFAAASPRDAGRSRPR